LTSSEWLTPEAQTLLMDGVKMTVGLTLITSWLALLIGAVMCRVRLSRSIWLRSLAIVYIELCRNIPALVWVIFFAFALPNAFPLETRRELFFRNNVMMQLRAWTGVAIPYYLLGAALGLTINTSAYLAELLRAGISTLSDEHLAAARSLGAGSNFLFFRALLPHGIRTASPSIITRLVHNLKNTALASFVAVPELFKAVQTAISRSFYAVEFLLLAAVIYLALAWIYALILRWLLPKPLTAGGHRA
jgi:polar amino acid transport system permease protein